LLENQLFHNRTMDFSRKLKAGVQAVTAADVIRVAKAKLDPKRLVVIDAGDHAKGLANAAAAAPAQK
jgi:predicted Zn-dependent peptidase